VQQVVVKTANPFVPTVTLLTVSQRKRRGRVKFAVFSVLGSQVVLLLALLIQGNQSELSARARSPGDAPDSVASSSGPLPDAARPPSAVPATAANTAAAASVSRPTSEAPPQPARVASAESANPAVGRAEVVYTVRSGDTLSRIARLYGTSVKAIKACNGLTTERLAVGAKLKLPDANLLAASASQPGDPL
jgi:LysM repeat protein